MTSEAALVQSHPGVARVVVWVALGATSWVALGAALMFLLQLLP